MEKTWTVVKFEDENVVEAVPTTWIVNNKCYWPPYTIEKIFKTIKDHVDFDPSWTSYKVYVFKNSTSASYQACRLKAKKAEDTSDLNSDSNKRKIKKNRFYDSDSSLESDIESDHTMLPSPPNLKEYSDTEIPEPADKKSQTGKENTHFRENYIQKNKRCNDYVNNKTCGTFNLKEKCSNKQNRTIPNQIFTTGKENNTPNTYFGERCNSSLNNDVPGTSNTSNIYCNIQQRHSQKDMNIHGCNINSNNTIANKETEICTCCPIHKNSDEKFRRIFKELFLLREITKECCEELKVTILQQRNVNITDGNNNEPTFLNTFHFPLRNVEELEEVEQYLQEQNRFQFTVIELSKIGGTTPYDFIKRCLSLLLTNRFAEQYSWYGAKKKQIFGKLHLANVLLESAQLCKAATNRKEVEEAIKAWLRRAKERAAKEEK